VGLNLDSSLLIADEREHFSLASWLRARPPEPVAVSAITFSELSFGVDFDFSAARGRRRRRWLEKTFRRLEIVAFDEAVARHHARLWVQLTKKGLTVGPHDLIVAATAMHRHWCVATFNGAEFKLISGLKVVAL
jgi:tRNA(fMet)-specific endonuclease VapC